LARTGLCVSYHLDLYDRALMDAVSGSHICPFHRFNHIYILDILQSNFSANDIANPTHLLVLRFSSRKAQGPPDPCLIF
jgi:hypothetical protein